MASEGQVPVNGNYGHHQGYGIEQHNPYAQQNFQQAPPAAPSTAPSTNGNSDIAKDEVGWYFVEQYYTTLSKSPENLYLYYNKRSQYVSGDETAKVQVCVGQRAINDRIKELDFQDCKVRITNVDSQGSDNNIVIQVIGEISNKSQPHRKFTQTFVLATQTNGYFVLNDIFRYIIEEEDEVEPQADTGAEEELPTAGPTPSEGVKTETKTVPNTLATTSEPAEIEATVKEIDSKIEEKIIAPAVNGHAEETKTEPVAETSESPERPTEPEPTPAASPPKQAPAQPAAAPKPAVPRTWASLAASANKVATPKTAVPAAQPKAVEAKAPAAPSAPAAETPAPAQETAAEGDEWTAVSGSHNRQQSRQVNGPAQAEPQRKAYIENVGEGVQPQDLKEVLEKFGKVSHVDINRQKNCAFVDFDTAEGYQSAVAANPHTVGSDSLLVEERKIRTGAPFVPRGQFQGGRGGRGDARGGRGSFPARGRGAGRGRGGAQQA